MLKLTDGGTGDMRKVGREIEADIVEASVTRL